jgi:hypothetical protein
MTVTVEVASLVTVLVLPEHVGVLWVVNNWLSLTFTSLLPAISNDPGEP